jgi:peptidyl-prolyl cis-trans isomerase D
MLQKIHDAAKGWLAYVIVAIIIVPFALWGLHEYLGGGGDRVVAVVQGQEIPVRAVQAESRAQLDRLQAMFGGQVPRALLDSELRSREALEAVVTRAVLQDAAEAKGFRIGDELIVRELQRTEAFQDNGVFDPARYERLLQVQRLSQAGFEEQLRQDLRLEQLVDAPRVTTFLAPGVRDDFLRLSAQERELAALRVSVDSLAAQVTPSDEDIAAYYEAQAERFMAPERVRLAYLEISAETLAEGISIDERELREEYEARGAELARAERRRASHILLEIPLDADEQVLQEIRSRAQGLARRAQDGEDFAALAREHSDDQLSAAAGGDLGSLARGDLDPLFDQALFALAEGEVSDAVRTPFGFHVIRLDAIERPELPPFEAQREDIDRELRAQEAEIRLLTLVEELATLGFENPDSLQPAAAATGLAVQTSAWLTRDSGEGIGALREVREAAFADEVFVDRRNSEIVELTDGRILLLRIAEHEPARARPLAEVREEVVAALRLTRAREQAGERAQALEDRVRAGEDPAALAAADPAVELLPAQWLRRDAPGLPGPVRRAGFALAEPAAGALAVTRELAGSGDAYVVMLSAVRAGVSAGEGGALAARLQAEYAGGEQQAFIEALRARAEVSLFPENL